MCLGRLPGDQRITQPVTRPLADHLRHETPDGTRFTARQRRRHVDRSRPLGAAVIGATRRPGRIRPGKISLFQRHFDAVRVDRPPRLRTQRVEHDFRFGENLGQVEHRSLHVEADPAFLLAGFKGTCQSTHPRQVPFSFPRQTGKPGFDAVGLDAFRRALPFGAQSVDLALRRIVRQQLARLRVKRQVIGEQRQIGQIQLAGAERTQPVLATDQRLPVKMKIGWGDVYSAMNGTFGAAILLRCFSAPTDDFDRSPIHREALGRKAPAQPPADPFEIKHRQTFGQLNLDVAQGDVAGHRARPTIAERQPGPECATPLRQAQGIVDPALPDGQIGIGHLGKNLAIPVHQPLDATPVQFATQIDLGRHRLRRYGGHAETVRAPIIVEGEIDILENQRRRLAQLVLPDQRCTFNAQPVLCQHPIAERIVAIRGSHRHAGDKEMPLRIAAQIERRFFDAQQA